MSLEDKITADYKEAMKNKEPARVSTISFLRSQIKYALIEKRAEKLSDADVIVVIKKQIKQRQDSIEQFEKGNRPDLAEKEKGELLILRSYLPAQMPPEEIRSLVIEVIKETGAASIKDMGKVMKILSEKVAGRADGKLISDILKEELAKV